MRPKQAWERDALYRSGDQNSVFVDLFIEQAEVPVQVFHGLGRVPMYYNVVWSDDFCSVCVYMDNNKQMVADGSMVYLTFSQENVRVRLEIG